MFYPNSILNEGICVLYLGNSMYSDICKIHIHMVQPMVLLIYMVKDNLDFTEDFRQKLFIMYCILAKPTSK
jgi:hypothetical protein